MQYRFDYLYPEEFRTAAAHMPIFLAPTGLLEWHGNHLSALA